jgi:hypothetical protein
MESKLIYIISFVVIFSIVFLVVREFWTWYWKINDILKLLYIQIDLLRKIVDKLTDDEVEEPQQNENNKSEKDNKNIKEEQTKEKKPRKTLKEMFEEEKRKLLSK